MAMGRRSGGSGRGKTGGRGGDKAQTQRRGLFRRRKICKLLIALKIKPVNARPFDVAQGRLLDI